MATATEAPASVTAEGPTSHTLKQPDTRPTGTHGYTRAEQIEALHKLREPFVESEIRYRPQPWCRSCSDSRTKNCQDHEKRQCRTCGQKLTVAHIDLKYIGHAEATNRLLNVDPFWDWEPLALDPQGLPQYDGNRALWIRMTVCGMTRLGYGDATGKTGANAVKEIIGDAIRNAGMRFGMALDLWTSSDLEIIEAGGPAADVESQPVAKSQPGAVTAVGSAPTSAVSSAAPAPAGRDFLAEAQQAPVDGVVRTIYNEAKALGVAPELLAQIAQVGKSKPAGPDPIDQLMDQARKDWGIDMELTKVLAEAGRRSQLLREVEGPVGMVRFGDMVTARIAELKEQARQAELNGPQRSAT